MTRLSLYQHAHGNSYTILMAATNLSLPVPLDPLQYDAVAAEITRMRENPIPAGVQDRRVVPLKPPRLARLGTGTMLAMMIEDEPIPEWEDIV